MCVFVFSGFNKHQTPGFAALALTYSVCVCEAKLRGAEAAVQAALQQDVHSFGHLCLGLQALCLLFLMGAAGHLQGSHHECC